MKTKRQNALFCVLAAVLLLGGCKDLFHPEGPEESNSNAPGGSNTIGAPSAPYSVYAEAVSSDTIIVTWDYVSGASGYRIYRSSSSSGAYSLLGEQHSDPYTDTGLSPNTTYYYKVSAYNSYGESARSNAATATTLASNELPESLSAPSSVSASAQSSSSITVSWSTVSGATGYRVYRSSSSSGTYSQTGEVYTTSYTDTGLSPNTTYYYKVSAYNSYGESARSNAVFATTQQSGGSDPIAPSFGTPLTVGQAAQNSINTMPQYYYFSAMLGRTYTVYWYDYDSSHSGGDVRVSAYWDSNGDPVIDPTDVGYNGISFIAARTGYVMLEVTQVGSGSGPYQILYR